MTHLMLFSERPPIYASSRRHLRSVLLQPLA